MCNDLGACFVHECETETGLAHCFERDGSRALLPIDEQSAFDFVDPLLTVCSANLLPLRNSESSRRQIRTTCIACTVTSVRETCIAVSHSVSPPRLWCRFHEKTGRYRFLDPNT